MLRLCTDVGCRVLCYLLRCCTSAAAACAFIFLYKHKHRTPRSHSTQQRIQRQPQKTERARRPRTRERQSLCLFAPASRAAHCCDGGATADTVHHPARAATPQPQPAGQQAPTVRCRSPSLHTTLHTTLMHRAGEVLRLPTAIRHSALHSLRTALPYPLRYTAHHTTRHDPPTAPYTRLRNARTRTRHATRHKQSKRSAGRQDPRRGPRPPTTQPESYQAAPARPPPARPTASPTACMPARPHAPHSPDFHPPTACGNAALRPHRPATRCGPVRPRPAMCGSVRPRASLCVPMRPYAALWQMRREAPCGLRPSLARRHAETPALRTRPVGRRASSAVNRLQRFRERPGKTPWKTGP